MVGSDSSISDWPSISYTPANHSEALSGQTRPPTDKPETYELLREMQLTQGCIDLLDSGQPAQHLRPSGVLSCWPDGLELTPGFYPESNEQHRLLGVYLERSPTCSRVTSASSALGFLTIMRYTNPRTHAPTRSLTQNEVRIVCTSNGCGRGGGRVIMFQVSGTCVCVCVCGMAAVRFLIKRRPVKQRLHLHRDAALPLKLPSLLLVVNCNCSQTTAVRQTAVDYVVFGCW